MPKTPISSASRPRETLISVEPIRPVDALRSRSLSSGPADAAERWSPQSVFAAAAAAASNTSLKRSALDPVADRPSGFARNFALAKTVNAYVDGLTKVALSRPSHLYSDKTVDEQGRLTRYTLHPEARARSDQLSATRERATAATVRQLKAIDPRGDMLTRYERRVQLWRHCNAEILRLSETIGADKLVANCFEKAMLGFDMIARMDDNPQIDVVSLESDGLATAHAAITNEPKFLARGPDHAFLVIGRDPESDVRDPASWGEDAVICDAWAKRIYGAATIEEEMALISSTTNGAVRCEMQISLPDSTVYGPDPRTLYLTVHGAGAVDA